MSKKARWGRHGRRGRKIPQLLFLLTIIIVAGFLAYFVWSAAVVQPNAQPLGLDAAIVDQLGATLPNPAFVKAAEDTLNSAGFSVKYYPAGDVTVDLYKRLPSLGYRLIVLRVHSGATYDLGVYPFTSEFYDEHKYTLEQLTGSLRKASVSHNTGPYYFAISPTFVASDMQGNFEGAIIVLSSCNGLVSNSLADPLMRRGASAVISWDGPVTLDHTDRATEVLLKALAERSTISQAVRIAMDQVGPDPEYLSSFRYYPQGAGQVTVWTLASADLNQGNQVISQIIQQKVFIRPKPNESA